MSRIFSAALTALIFALLVVGPAGASGLKTHLWIAQQIIDDLRPDCSVELASRQYRIPDETCRAILDNPGSFLAGALGPDAYPDIIAGQVTTHPGIEGDWQTSDWLRHLYRSASSPSEVAFAAGYLIHAATDAFAHTYVNGYAGDVFELGDERAVELRHFVLEKYIDAHLPAGEPDPNALDAPSEFLARTLILNDDAARNARASGTASHIWAMNEVYDAVGDLERNLDAVEETAGDVAATLTVEGGELAIRLADGEIALTAADEALRLREEQLRIEQAAFDSAKAVLDDAIDAVEANEALITGSELRARVATEAIEAARNVATEANGTISSLEQDLIGLRRRLSELPSRVCHDVQRTVCENVCRWLGCRSICDEVTRVVCVVPDAWTSVSNEISRAESRLTAARQRLIQAGIDESANAAILANALQTKLEAEGRRAALGAARASAEAAYEPVRLRYELELAATSGARTVAQNIRREVEGIRNRLVDIDSMKQAVRDLVADSDILSGLAGNWRRGIEVAAERYIEAGTTNAVGLVTGNGGGFSAYREWLSCYGGAFTPVPYQAGEFACNAVSEWERFNARLDQFILDLLPEPFASFYRDYLQLRADIRRELSDVTATAAVELAKMAAPDQSTRDFIDLLANPQNATASRLNDIFDEVGDSGGKPLLTFARATDLIDADAGIRAGGDLNPQAFSALRNAMTLSRYALLDQAGVNLVSWRLGGDLHVSAEPPNARYSVLFEALRSIDGNHQWQPYGLPYPRTSGPAEPVNAADRAFGWGPADSGPRGLPIFINETNRRRVFRELFPTHAAGRLADRPEMNGEYPFPQCDEHPFPVTFEPDGRPRSEDRTCASGRTESWAARQTTRAIRLGRDVLFALGLNPPPLGNPGGVSQEVLDNAQQDAEDGLLQPQTD